MQNDSDTQDKDPNDPFSGTRPTSPCDDHDVPSQLKTEPSMPMARQNDDEVQETAIMWVWTSRGGDHRNVRVLAAADGARSGPPATRRAPPAKSKTMLKTQTSARPLLCVASFVDVIRAP